MRLLVILVLLVLTGCSGLRAGTSHTVLTIGSGVGGVGDIHNKVCLWMFGTSGAYRGMAVLIAQGDVTLEECRNAHPSAPLELPPGPKLPAP